ncbi:MAG: DNA mismatch repair protein MutS [Myxococcales bacterium]|nr:DNA mismatch repair protein MutS [Myxococcales bacterium]
MPPQASAETPVMRQYLEIKARYPDCIIFFRLGDFYEMFFEDAVWAARALDLTLTTRDKNKEDPVPMCGVPYHAARQYIGRLIELGRKVAICEQVEDPRLARKIVRRAVTQVVTPGVVLEEEQLQPKAGHYLCAVAPGAGPTAGQVGVAHLDVSTGDFSATQMAAPDLQPLLDELCRIEPRELLVVGGQGDASALREELARRLRIPAGETAAHADSEDRALLVEALGESAAELEAGAGPHLSSWPLALAAAAACVRYARATQPAGTLPLVRLRLYRPDDEVVLDETSRTHLELFCTAMDRRRQGSLLSVIDETRTAMGGRLLRRWLAGPLRNVADIRARHDAVQWLVERHRLRAELLATLGQMYDLERLTGRLSLGLATPRDLLSLRRTLEGMPTLARLLASSLTDPEAGASPELGIGLPSLLDLGEDLCTDVAEQIAAAITDDPPVAWREGGFIRRGFHAELDELREIATHGRDHILRIEERERERTGIASLKVRYNRVFGYYIEITRANLGRVPADYTRKQTLAGAERFVTPELAELEARVLGADERRVQLELELLDELRRRLAPACPRLLGLAGRVARLDALAGLAEVAHRHGYVRPQVDDGLRIEIEDGRHPVVERLVASGRFVPNDTVLDPAAEQLLIITGPNMAGKSTLMRQVALICLLGQMGSFVPARRARLGVVDRIFTRVGAADNLAGGESTFMVEMRETAAILRGATRRSLVILDEIGRGTSTYDGLSIAWAVAEYLHDVIGCRTMFATHYHELCALAATHPRVRNFSVAVREWQGEIVFLYRLVEGAASRSYGIEVARLAGLPPAVLRRSREILAALEAGEAGPVHGGLPAEGAQLALFGDVHKPRRRRAGREPAPQLEGRERAVLERLRSLDCDGITPREALHLLGELAAQLQDQRGHGDAS